MCAVTRKHSSEEEMRAALSHLTISFWSAKSVATKVALCYIPVKYCFLKKALSATLVPISIKVVL